MCAQTIAKELHQLLRNVDSFSDNQATIENYDDMTNFDVVIIPNSGLYKRGKFNFTVTLGDDFPDTAPSVHCNTTIYHPNIDTCGDVCLNLLSDEWQPTFSLEDVVQGLLFLIYDPNLEDPLNEYFDGTNSPDEFEANVEMSLQGGEVDGVMYERNQVDDEESELIVTGSQEEDGPETTTNTDAVKALENAGQTEEAEQSNKQTDSSEEKTPDGNQRLEDKEESPVDDDERQLRQPDVMTEETTASVSKCSLDLTADVEPDADFDTRESTQMQTDIVIDEIVVERTSNDTHVALVCSCTAGDNEQSPERSKQLTRQGMWQSVKQFMAGIVNRLR